MSSGDNIFQPRQAFAHIRAQGYPNPDGFYEVNISQYNPFRDRTYITNNDARVNKLLEIADFVTVEAYGGELSICAGYRQRK